MKSLSKLLQKFYVLLAILFICCLSCGKEEDTFLPSMEYPEVTLRNSTLDTIVYATVDNEKVPIYISIPPGCNTHSLPAVVVMHGSDGMWLDHDIATGKMSGQNTEWRMLFDSNCIIGAYVDSYSGRGVSTRTGKWKTAPDNFKISSQFIRPKDAYAALEVLKKLKNENGIPLVRKKDIALLGFSDGASAVASTLYDTDLTPKDWEWTQNFDGKEYDSSSGVLPPDQKPEFGFAGGVFYYGGSGGYNYWGAGPCGNNAWEGNIYMPYAPILFQIPAEGYLTENTLCLVDLLKEKGAAVELNIYENVGHGFDFDDNPQSPIARLNTLNWFNKILHMEQ
ncbi:MAG: hypothetical protein VX798_06750 [Bacteroidota bacterium]|nr:hypothetical protein [Bacteroidota bacterium]